MLHSFMKSHDMELDGSAYCKLLWEEPLLTKIRLATSRCLEYSYD